MNTKSRIKVIKRNQQPIAPLIKTKTPQIAAREIVATVTEWVNEFQQKRLEETEATLNKLFPQTPTPNSCSNC
jgi:uncharacterized membrane-anchored protein